VLVSVSVCVCVCVNTPFVSVLFESLLFVSTLPKVCLLVSCFILVLGLTCMEFDPCLYWIMYYRFTQQILQLDLLFPVRKMTGKIQGTTADVLFCFLP